MTDLVRTRIDDSTATITLDRPGSGNALTAAVLDQLNDALDKVTAASDVRCVVLTAEGGIFCVGADVSFIDEADGGTVKTFLRAATDTFRRVETLSVPVVAAVRGHALGGGLELVLAADMAVAHPDAKLGLPEATIGLLPAGGGTQRLTRIVGRKKASELLFTGRQVAADDARELQLINRVDESPEEHAHSLAEEVATSAPLSVAACKRLALGAEEWSVERGLDEEQREVHALLDSADSEEGVSAFVEDRPPEFHSQ